MKEKGGAQMQSMDEIYQKYAQNTLMWVINQQMERLLLHWE